MRVRLLGAVNLCMASEPAELDMLLSVDSEASVGASGNVPLYWVGGGAGGGSVTEVVTVNLNFGKFKCWDPGGIGGVLIVRQLGRDMMAAPAPSWVGVNVGAKVVVNMHICGVSKCLNTNELLLS